MDIKKLKGLAVVSIDGGEKFGQIEDIIIDATERRISAVKIGSGGVLKRDHNWVPFSAVRSIGVDALMVQNSASLQPSMADIVGGSVDYGRLGSIKVVTEGGDFVGHLLTIHADTTSGRVTEFEVGTGGVTGMFQSNTLVSADSVITIGNDIMIVPASATEVAAEEQPAQEPRHEPEPEPTES